MKYLPFSLSLYSCRGGVWDGDNIGHSMYLLQHHHYMDLLLLLQVLLTGPTVVYL